MLIHAIDPGRFCGYAIGPAGERPVSGTMVLRQEGEDRAVGLFNLQAYLRKAWSYRKPDVLLFEAPMTVQAWLNNAKKSGRWHGGAAVESANEIAGCIMAVCVEKQVRWDVVHRISVMTTLTGKAGWGDRELNKRKVLEAVKARGFLSQECRDDDRADAVAIHIVGSAKHAKIKTRNSDLFSENSG